MTDLTTRLNRLADAVPDVRPLELVYASNEWWLHHCLIKSVSAHALWGWSILTHWDHQELNRVRGAWECRLGPYGTVLQLHRGATPLEAALSAAEAVAGIQQQEASNAN